MEYTETFETAHFLVGQVLFEADETLTPDFLVVRGELADDHTVVTTLRGAGELGSLDACNDVLFSLFVVGELLQTLSAYRTIVCVIYVGVAGGGVCLDERLVVFASSSAATR